MTGPEHYVEAERLVALASEDLTNPMAAAWAHLAQIHAQLAQAAAIAEPIAQSYDGPDDKTIPMAWSEAIS